MEDRVALYYKRMIENQVKDHLDPDKHVLIRTYRNKRNGNHLISVIPLTDIGIKILKEINGKVSDEKRDYTDIEVA